MGAPPSGLAQARDHEGHGVRLGSDALVDLTEQVAEASAGGVSRDYAGTDLVRDEDDRAARCLQRLQQRSDLCLGGVILFGLGFEQVGCEEGEAVDDDGVRGCRRGIDRPC